MLLTGLQLGQYRLLQQLGSGGMGEVYLAADERIGQHVAIKVSKTVNSSDHLFKREAKAIASLDHPRILPLFSYGEENVNGTTYTYIVMPHRREGSFADWLRQRAQRGPLAQQDVAIFVLQAAEALQYAHDHQIVHQDVKPSNFLLRDNPANPEHPDLLLADFGIAKLNNSSTNVSQSVRGTPTYMSPEQWSGLPVPATDQYALAVVAYELLVGRVPFVGRQEQVMFQHFSVQPQPPSALNRSVSPAVDAVILQAMAKQPADRFPSIMSFAQALQQATQIAPTIYAPPPPPVLQPTQISKTERAPFPYAPQTPQQGNAYPMAPAVQTLQTPPSPPQFYHPPIYGGPNTIDGQPFINRTTENNKHLPQPVGRIIILAGVLLLVIFGSVGILSAVNNLNSANGNSTTTTRAQQTQTAGHSGNTSQPTHTITATNPPATPTAPTTFPFSNRQVLNDSLSSNTSNGWYVGNTASGTCSFSNGVYQASQPGSGFNFCPAQNTNFNNFSYQVQMRLINGECGGLMLRGNPTTGDVYYYKVCSNGRYFFDHIANCINCSKIIKSGSLIGFTITSTNTIGIVANQNHFDLYLNGQHIDSVTDSTLNQGIIGLASDSAGTQTTILFAHAQLWQL